MRSHQAHLPPDVVYVVQSIQLRFVGIGIVFQARNALLDGLTEPRADLKAFLGGALNGHGEYLQAEFTEAEEFLAHSLKFFPLVPILTKHSSPRQITASRTFSNLLSEFRTVPGKRDGVQLRRFPTITGRGDRTNQAAGSELPQSFATIPNCICMPPSS
ncbi:hypothetical protein SBA5_70103 [Candidatus Sulfotelmatomonas gaucii]|uniref:Uncharacterized protein n=1 Tax=Candidatus Sulfuritelmatomonas gaucii TaxID=2043161 RepID=A0A2N9M0N2_9BACT|nr:hypothetical protein SBA5_70103 [Candidatus Sulfotelmatomonas gaucii]